MAVTEINGGFSFDGADAIAVFNQLKGQSSGSSQEHQTEKGSKEDGKPSPWDMFNNFLKKL